MKNYEITAWKINGPQDELEWSKSVRAESLGEALTLGQHIFRQFMPDADVSEYEVHASGS